LGTQAPDFALPDVVTGRIISLGSFKTDEALLVMFISRHCPYVQHVKQELARLGRDYIPRGVGMVAICANDPQRYPDDSPEHLKSLALELRLNYPLCHDASQETAKAYRAACTPEFYLFDENRGLVYRGQMDDSRPRNNLPVTGKDLRAALEALLSGREVSPDQKPGIGCNIKWKPGNEPPYFK
jgi:peroxiredoxin